MGKLRPLAVLLTKPNSIPMQSPERRGDWWRLRRHPVARLQHRAGRQFASAVFTPGTTVPTSRWPLRLLWQKWCARRASCYLQLTHWCEATRSFWGVWMFVHKVAGCSTLWLELWRAASVTLHV